MVIRFRNGSEIRALDIPKKGFYSKRGSRSKAIVYNAKEKSQDMFKVIIAGGRDFNDYEFLKRKCDSLLRYKKEEEIEIVSGTARGADSLGERYARERGYKLTQFPADWDKFGKRAGYLRNGQMADYANALIAFYNGSKGTGHMIDLAKEKGLEVRICTY